MIKHDNTIEKINFHLDVGQGRAEAIMSYVQILDHLDHQEQHDDLYKFRAIPLDTIPTKNGRELMEK